MSISAALPCPLLQEAYLEISRSLSQMLQAGPLAVGLSCGLPLPFSWVMASSDSRVPSSSVPCPQPMFVESVFAARTYPSSSGPGPLQVQVQGPAACVLQRLLMSWLHAAPRGQKEPAVFVRGYFFPSKALPSTQCGSRRGWNLCWSPVGLGLDQLLASAPP